MRKGTIFGGLGITASLYVILFVAVMYSGSTFIAPYVMPLICVLVMMLFGMAKVKGIQKVAFWNRNDGILKAIMVMIVGFLIFQLSISYNRGTTLAFVERFFVYGLLFFFIPNLELNYKIIKAIRLYSFPVAVSIIITTLVNGSRSGGLVGNYQFAGMMMSISFGVMLISYYFERNRWDAVGMVLTLMALFMSGKRTFSLLAVLAYILVARLNNDPGKRKRFISLSLFIVIAVVVAYFTVPPVRLLLERIEYYAGDTSYNGRSYFWTAAFDIFKQKKLFGIGMGCFAQYFDVFYHRLGNMKSLDAHNVYIQMAAELGIIGEALFIGLFLYSLVTTFRLLKSQNVQNNKKAMYVLVYSIFLQVWFLVYNMTGNPLYGAGQCFFYISSIAMMMSVKRYVKETERYVE